jgi:uncharacterized protein
MVKYLIVILVVGGLLWWALRQRDRLPEPPAQRPPTDPARPAAMVRCDQCGMHLPRDEALPGAESGFFCSEAHRRLGPGTPRQ